MVGGFASLFRMSIEVAFLALFGRVRVPHQRRGFVAAMDQYRGCDFVHFVSRNRYNH